MQIRPIQNESDHDAALARISALMSVELDSAKGAELDALVTLVDAYEEKHFPIEVPSPIAVIDFMLDQKSLTRKDLEPMIGSRARVSEVMNGKRGLTIAMIQRLRDQLGISADLLIAQPHRSRLSHKPLTGSSKSPQQKKKLSLQLDRRNTYGENAKASRKNVPRSKRDSQKAMRRSMNTPLQSLRGKATEDFAVDRGPESRTKGIAKNRSRFRKVPDESLGTVLDRKRTRKKVA
jgi:HTH-type transcriptional regulator/antitoxin HigA